MVIKKLIEVCVFYFYFTKINHVKIMKTAVTLLEKLFSEAITEVLYQKKVFLKILQNSQENTSARASFLIKLQARPATFLKKELWRRLFLVNLRKF